MACQAITDRSQKPRHGVAMGGIGCGWFQLRQDKQFLLFFVPRIQVEGEDPCLKLLQIEESHDSAGISGHEFPYIFPWLQGVDRIALLSLDGRSGLSSRSMALPAGPYTA